MKTYKSLLTPVLAALVAAGAWAMPPIPGFIKASQPDGTPVELSLRGDEYFSWAVSPDGYTLIRDDAGYWTVAMPDVADNPVASDIRYAGSSAALLCPDAKPGLRFNPVTLASRRTSRRAKNIQIENSFPTTGKRKLLMLLVNFADTYTTYSPQDFNAQMNSEGYGGIGSFRDYYLENSYNQLDIETVVTDWITLPMSKSYYNIDNVPEMIYYVLQQLSDIDLKEFDNDNDGVIDGIALIHQGTGQEASGDPADIWSHSSSVSGFSVNGVKLGRYTCEPEILATTGKMQTVGVICHEFGHNLGAPDFYDTDYASGGEFPGTGVWDLMGSGAWNGTRGDRPAGINMWQKIQYGWVTPILLSEEMQVRSMPGATCNPVAYRMNTNEPDEYFIIENRMRQGSFDSALPGAGVLIYHADEKLIAKNIFLNTLNATYPQAMYTVCSGATSQMPNEDPDSYGNLIDAPFPGSRRVTSFTDNSTPSARSNSGRLSYCGLHNISLNSDGTANFDFVKDNAPASPSDFVAKASRGEVELSWSIPADAKWTHFNLYRNGSIIAQLTDTRYTDRYPDASRLTYQVEAVTPEGLVSPYVSASLRMPVNKVNSIETENADGVVTLTLKLSDRLSRLEEDSSIDTFILSEHQAAKGEFAHRFTADDLITYIGMKISKVSFLTYLGPQDASYTVKVWEADSDGSNPRVVSERLVKEFGAGVWNNIRLTQSVEILPDREYWIGFEMTSLKGAIQVVGSVDTTPEGLGNLMRLDGEDWKADSKMTGTYFIYASLLDIPHTAGAPLQTFAPDIDVDTDLVYPIGFSVYRNGQLVGNTSSRCFVDSNVPNGSHTYSVASLYKGDNESGTIETQVNVTSSGIEDVNVASSSLLVCAASGELSVSGAQGILTITDLCGRTILSTSRPEVRVSLPAGVYLISAANGKAKIMLR